MPPGDRMSVVVLVQCPPASAFFQTGDQKSLKAEVNPWYLLDFLCSGCIFTRKIINILSQKYNPVKLKLVLLFKSNAVQFIERKWKILLVQFIYFKDQQHRVFTFNFEINFTLQKSCKNCRVPVCRFL